MKGKKENHQWERVHGSNLDKENINRAKANKNVFEGEHFNEICEELGIKPTKRQASKYRRKQGLVFNYGKS